MTMTQQQERVTVTATVAAHGLWNGKPVTDLNIPDFGSDYPTKLYGVTPVQQAELPLGQTVRVILARGSLQKGKDGGKPWMYFWNYVGLGDAAPPSVQPATGPQAARSAAFPPPTGADARDLSIQRQVALKAAVEWGIAHLGRTDVDPTTRDVLAVAARFSRFLATGQAPPPPDSSQPAQEEEPTPESP